ncbi:MAG: hypothetical protein IK008_04350 [Bacteroidales bacterium]|nr:hypothetical protein [Bacteroidales bacterium]
MQRSLLIILFAAALSLGAAAQGAGISKDGHIETVVEEGRAQVRLTFSVRTDQLQVGTFVTRILYKEYRPGKIIEHVVAESRNVERVWDGKEILQTFELDPVLYWTPETPTVFYARTAAEFSESGRDACENTFLFRGPAPETLKGVILPADESWDKERWDCLLTLLKRQGINAVAPAAVDSTVIPDLIGDLCDRIGLIQADSGAVKDFRAVSDVLDADYFPAERELKGGPIAKFGILSAYKGKTLTLIQVQAMDRSGRPVPNPVLTFEVKGPARLEAVGKASVFVRTTGPGTVTVTAASKNRGKVVFTFVN